MAGAVPCEGVLRLGAHLPAGLNMVVLPQYGPTHCEHARDVLAIHEFCVERGQSTPPSAHAAIAYTIPPGIPHYRRCGAVRIGKSSCLRCCRQSQCRALHDKGCHCRPGEADTRRSQDPWPDDDSLNSCRVTVTLSGLLDPLDSIDAQEGRQLLVATTNEYSTSHTIPPRSPRYARGVHYCGQAIPTRPLAWLQG